MTINKKPLIFFIFSCLFFLPVSFCLAQVPEFYNNAEFNKAVRSYYKTAENNDISGYLNLAVIFKDLVHYERGIKVLNSARVEFGNDSRILRFLGRLYYLNGQLDSSISVFSLLLKNEPDDRDALITLGLCYLEKENIPLAQEYFQKILKIDKDNVVARLSLAELYYRQNKLEESVREYKALSFIDASIGQVYEYWGDILIKMGNFKEALKIYEKISFMDPQNKQISEKLSGIRKELGKEYFEKGKAERKIAKERKLVFVKPADKVKNAAFIKIGLASIDGSAEFKCSTNFTVKTRSNQFLIGQGNAGESYSILKTRGNNKLLITNTKKENMVIDEPIVIKPAKAEGAITLFDIKFGSDNFWSNAEDRSYRGEIEVSVDNGVIKIINQLSMEEYLYGVIPAEMPTNWPLEALKTQAVAARSESIAKLGRHRSEGFDLCAEVHCQVYGGVEKETELGNMAVNLTRGMILEYDSKPVDAIYSSNCGGHTQGNIFGSKGFIPYFIGTMDMPEGQKLSFPLSPLELESWLKDPPAEIYCNIPEYSKSSNFRWVRIYSAEQLRGMVDKISPVGDIKKIIVLKRNVSGHVDKIKFTGSDGVAEVQNELRIRKLLGNLRSSMFKVETKYGQDGRPEEFIFYGGGWGHGVGMCQAGACGMAKAGKAYKDILLHYFPRAVLKKIY